MDIRKILDFIAEAEKPLAKGMKVMTPAEFLQSQGIEPESGEEDVAEAYDIDEGKKLASAALAGLMALGSGVGKSQDTQVIREPVPASKMDVRAAARETGKKYGLENLLGNMFSPGQNKETLLKNIQKIHDKRPSELGQKIGPLTLVPSTVDSDYIARIPYENGTLDIHLQKGGEIKGPYTTYDFTDNSKNPLYKMLWIEWKIGKSQQDNFDVQEQLDEAEKLKGVSQKPFPKDELIKYLDRVVGEPVLDKEGKPKLDKKGNPQFKSLKTKTDKYKFPYIHRSNVPIVNQDGQKYDLDKLASLFTERPSKILKQNEKMQHSDGTASQFYNVGLPALTGLAVDEENKEFVVINTCPGAGNCKLVCYAMKGGYIQYPASNLSQTRLLNFLYNDPDGFMGMLENEIAGFEAKNSKKNIKTIIRWHDAGDFFSPEYLDKAYNLAKKFPDVDFYAYTKLASVAQGDKPDNFKINFSMGAQPSQEKKIDFAKTKNSRIVPEVLFADALEKDDDGKWQYKNDAAEKAVKDRIAAKYSLDPKSIITYDEMMKIPVGKEKGKWNVIVKPGDGDDAANRNDVLSSLLLIH